MYHFFFSFLGMFKFCLDREQRNRILVTKTCNLVKRMNSIIEEDRKLYFIIFCFSIK